MKIYISGPITGIPDGTWKAFSEAYLDICALEHIAVNPLHLDHSHDGSWAAYMRVDIRALTNCDAILMLHGWQNSKGAKLEYLIALELGMTVFDSIESIPKDGIFIRKMIQWVFSGAANYIPYRWCGTSYYLGGNFNIVVSDDDPKRLMAYYLSSNEGDHFFPQRFRTLRSAQMICEDFEREKIRITRKDRISQGLDPDPKPHFHCKPEVGKYRIDQKGLTE